MPISIQSHRGALTPPTSLVRRTAQTILSGLGLTDAELSIAFVDDAAIRVLNRDWRRLDRATDVLSFSQLEGEGPAPGRAPLFLGDVVNFFTETTRVGHTSITVKVSVEVERLSLGGGPTLKVTEAEVVLVAVDEEGRPTAVRDPVP